MVSKEGEMRASPGAMDLGRLRSVLALALGAAGCEGFVAAELAPEGALERAPGVKVAAVGLNLNSLALGFSFEAGAVEGLPPAESPCSIASPTQPSKYFTECFPTRS